MASALEQSGSQAQKPTRYSSLTVNRQFTGLWSQRNPLRDAASTRLEEKFYGGRGDALIDGSNVEISNRLTLIRRPGQSVYNSQTFSAVDQFYAFKLEDGKTIFVMVDDSTGVYDGTGPNTKNLIFAKSASSGQVYFQSVLDILYMSDGGTDQFKWVKSTKSWACGTQFFPGDFIVDPNGNLERVARPIDLPPGNPESPTQGPNTAQTGANSGAGVAWTSPGNVSSNSSQATVNTTTASQASATLSASHPGVVTSSAFSSSIAGQYRNTGQANSDAIISHFPITVPLGATILGVQASVPSNSQSSTAGTFVQMALNLNGADIGVPISVSQTLTPAIPAPIFQAGGVSNTWGATLTDVIINNPNFGIHIYFTGDGVREFFYTYEGEPISITVYYSVTNTNGSQFLQATNFGFAIAHPPIGVQVKFDASLTMPSPDAVMTVQLILSNTPLGAAKETVPGSTLSTITLGGTDDLWGTALTTGNANDPTFGVQFRAFGGGSWAVGNVTITFTTSVDNLITASCPATQPNWPLNWGASVVDGNITWINSGPGLQKFSIAPPTTAPSVTNIVLPSSSISGLSPWQSSTWYLNALRIDDGTNIEMITTAGTTGAVQPAWNPVVGGTTNDGTVVWTNKGSNTWQANHTYLIGDAIVVTYNSVTPIGVQSTANNQNVYTWPGHVNQYGNNLWTNSVTVNTDFFIVVKVGVSGSTQPTNPSNSPNTPPNPYPPNQHTWQTGIGTKVVDGGVIWQNSGPTATWNTFGGNQALASVNLIIDTNSNQQEATITGETGIVHPVWLPNVNQVTNETGVSTPEAWLNKGVISSGVTAAPTSSTLAAQGLAWTYYYTYRNSVTGDESSASPASAQIVLAPNSAISVQGLNSPDPQVDTIRIYRTTAGGAIPFLLAEIPNVALTGTWTFIDTIPDSQLNNLIQAPIDHVNDVIPVGLINLAYHLGRLFGSIGNTVYYSGGPDTNPGNGITAFDPLNFFIFPAYVHKLVPTSSGLWVFTASGIFLIFGQGTASSPLEAVPYILSVGLASYNELDTNAGIMYLKTADGQFIEIQPGTGVSELGFPIGDQPSISTPGIGYVTWHVNGSRDKAIYVSDGSTGWFRCSPTASPETGFSWSPFATLANPGGAKAVQSVEVTPGVHRLLVGPLTTGPILQRDYNTYADNGALYSAFATLGGITLAHPGQLAEVVYISTDCLAIGSHPSPATMFNELPSSGLFTGLVVPGNPVPDPTYLPSSTTVYNDRWSIGAAGNPTICRWMFLRISWPAENFANEMLQFGTFGTLSKE
jgi:hypothetical protein